MATQKVPKRLRLKPHMSIDGVRVIDGEPRRLQPGLYIVGKNMTEAEAIALASDEFTHCVEILPDVPEEEELAKDAKMPQPALGYQYSRQKAHEAEIERWERDHGKSVRKPDHLRDSQYLIDSKGSHT